MASASDRNVPEGTVSDYPADIAIARRAYELYESRGCADGFDVQDWLQAEHELQGHPEFDEESNAGDIQTQ